MYDYIKDRLASNPLKFKPIIGNPIAKRTLIPQNKYIEKAKSLKS